MDNERPRSDWLTILLLAVTAFLLAGLAAVGADLWLWPPADGPVAEAAELYQPALAQVASVQSALPLNVETVRALPPTSAPVAATVRALPPTSAPVAATVRALPPTSAPVAATVRALPPTTAPVAATVRALPPTKAPAYASDALSSSMPSACAPPVGWSLYIVQGGDRLGSIARRYGTDVETLMRANCLDVPILAIDQRLYVPVLPGSEAPATATATALPTPTQAPRLGGASATPVSGASPAPLSTVVDDRPAASTPAYVASLPTFAPTATPKDAFRLTIPNRYVNIVLLGSDKRARGRTWRTDSMIIVSVDVENNVVRLLSIPRDLWVYIPRHGYDRINTAELWAELSKKGTGTERVKQTIHHNLGIPIHYYVRVDFRGFMKIIDTVGGVDIDVDCPLPDIKLEPGIYHMDGAHALQYARSRHSTTDFDRGRRQRKVLTALWDKSRTMDIIPKLPSLWVTLADSFETDLPFDQVINLAYIGAQLKPQHIMSKSIGRSQVKSWMTPGGAAVLLPREDQIRTLLEGYYTPVDPTKLDTVDNVRIQVLNGTQRRDAEKLAVAALRWEGVKVAGTGQADRQDYAETEVRVYQGDLGAGEAVARQLGVPLTAVRDLIGAQDQAMPSDLEIQVILGKDYDPCQR